MTFIFTINGYGQVSGPSSLEHLCTKLLNTETNVNKNVKQSVRLLFGTSTLEHLCTKLVSTATDSKTWNWLMKSSWVNMEAKYYIPWSSAVINQIWRVAKWQYLSLKTCYRKRVNFLGSTVDRPLLKFSSIWDVKHGTFVQ